MLEHRQRRRRWSCRNRPGRRSSCRARWFQRAARVVLSSNWAMRPVHGAAQVGKADVALAVAADEARLRSGTDCTGWRRRSRRRSRRGLRVSVQLPMQMLPLHTRLAVRVSIAFFARDAAGQVMPRSRRRSRRVLHQSAHIAATHTLLLHRRSGSRRTLQALPLAHLVGTAAAIERSV